MVLIIGRCHPYSLTLLGARGRVHEPGTQTGRPQQQSLSGHGRPARRRARWHRHQLDPGEPVDIDPGTSVTQSEPNAAFSGSRAWTLPWMRSRPIRCSPRPSAPANLGLYSREAPGEPLLRRQITEEEARQYRKVLTPGHSCNTCVWEAPPCRFHLLRTMSWRRPIARRHGIHGHSRPYWPAPGDTQRSYAILWL